MSEYLQRALIEVCYAIADFNEVYPNLPNTEQRAETCARLFIVRRNLERLLSPEQVAELTCTA